MPWTRRPAHDQLGAAPVASIPLASPVSTYHPSQHTTPQFNVLARSGRSWNLESQVLEPVALEHNQRVLERTAARNSLEAYGLGAQIAALESCDPWAGVPAALLLRSFANKAFGTDLTPEAVRRIRGRVCEAMDIDTATADALTFTHVVEALAEADAEDKRHLSNPDGTADPLQTEFRWLKVTQIAKLFALNPGQVSKQADAGTFLTSGKTGHDRRIDVLSVVKKELERLNRSSIASAFTDE